MEEFDHLKIQLKDVILATNTFAPNKRIGDGGFGSVYKGELSRRDGLVTVACKRLNPEFGQGHVEFLKEIVTLSKYKHENLVSLLHFCIEGDERILVYEYASRGSLDRYLSDPSLTWTQRLKICVGVAHALHYLHDPADTHQRILHRDIKSSNILLDEEWSSKVSDFGLSKFGPANQPQTYVISNAVGTPGYCDPLYWETGILSKESDVYSLGVVLFEVMCGRFCCEYRDGKLLSILVHKWKKCYEEKRLDDIIFHGLKKHMEPDSLNTFSTIAYQCLKRARKERPTMGEIVQKLEIALAQQEVFDNVEKFEKTGRNADLAVSPLSYKLASMQFVDMVENIKMPDPEYEVYIGLPSQDILDVSSLQIIRNDDVEELWELGSATTFEKVYHGRWKGIDVAIKRIKKSFLASEQEKLTTMFWQEAVILSKLYHPNIVAFYGVVQDGPGETLATVNEFMVDDSLRRVLLRNHRHLDHQKKLIIAMDAAFGMEYLHSKNIVHFDIRSDNLLVDMKDLSRPVCKVGGFGLSKIMRDTLVSGGVRETLPWMAPELLNGSSNKVSEKVDVYAFGIVLWEIMTGEEPYADMHSIKGGIVSNTLRPPIPKDCDGEWRTLMEQCWAHNPIDRPSFTEITGSLRVMSLTKPKAVMAIGDLISI